MTRDRKGQGVQTKRPTICWGRRGFPGGEALVFPAPPQLGAGGFLPWPFVSVLLLSDCPPHLSPKILTYFG